MRASTVWGNMRLMWIFLKESVAPHSYPNISYIELQFVNCLTDSHSDQLSESSLIGKRCGENFEKLNFEIFLASLK